MSSNKATFKGFTFKRSDQSPRLSAPPPAKPPLTGFTKNAFSRKDSRDGNGLTKSQTSAVSSNSTALYMGSTSMSMPFLSKKANIAVATIIPQGTPTPDGSLRKHDSEQIPKTSPIYVPKEILEDDDFEPSFSQRFVGIHGSFNFKSSSKTSSKKPAEKDNYMADPHVIPKTPVKRSNQAQADSDGEVCPHPKRRRANRILESDEEDGTKKVEVSPIKNKSPRKVSSVADVYQHSLLKKNSFDHNNPEEVQTLKNILLNVADEVCGIICKIPNPELMKLVTSDYERLRTLLTIRKRVKDFNAFDIGGRSSSSASDKITAHSTSPIKKSPIMNKKSPIMTKKRNNIERNPSSTPIMFTENLNKGQSNLHGKEIETLTPIQHSKPLKKLSGSNFSSSSQANSINISKKADTSVNYLDESSFICGQKMNTPCYRNDNMSNSNIDANEDTSFGKTSPENNEIDDIIDKSFEDDMEAALELHDEEDCIIMSQNVSPSRTNYSPVKQNVSDMRKTVKSHQEIAHGKSNASLVQQEISELDYNTFDSVEDTDDESIVVGDVEENEYEYVPVFSSTDHDDGATNEFIGMTFEHSSNVYNLFRQVFGLKEFRHNQLQAINAALLGHDCFILMPTGGGKSLCYQLPAIVSSGVSIIVSPLRALIQDQTQRLTSLDIPATYLSSDTDVSQSQMIYTGMFQRNPAFKMLYVTPEKLSASEKLLSCLDHLYNRQLLMRFVIDEAHCVSQWGHDFRPDYKRLKVLRERFPGVPMMALTATATPRVRKDVVHQLGMTCPKWFMQSFNRPNLKYTVQPKKPSNAAADVIDLIKSKFAQDCGIIYCLSRKECDTVANDLMRSGLKAQSYHAGLDDNVRARVQEKWLNDENCKIICATIAFGMGIDKADVRFVIHYSLPKSVEGYYQEAGRAGRDGVLSHCILLYTYQDVKRLRRMIEMDKNANFESKRVHSDNLYRMVNYCENVADCRRSQVLQYFGENSFDRRLCKAMKGAACDNCLSQDSYNLRDVTANAQEIVKCVKQLNSVGRNNYTLIHILEIFKGSQSSKLQNLGHTKLALHGKGKSWTRQDAERLCRKLVIDGILREDLQVTAQDHTVCYIKLGSKALDLMSNKIKVEMPIQGGRNRAEVTKVGKESKNVCETLVQKCLAELRAMAKSIASEYSVKSYAQIFPESALKQLAERTPITIDEMIDQIDHFNATIVEKYEAHRLLEITLKYSMELAALSPDVSATDGGAFGSDFLSDGEHASRYFEDPSPSVRGRGRWRGHGGKSRGGKRRYTSKRKDGKGKARGAKSGSSRGRGAKSSRGSSLAEFSYKTPTQSFSKASGSSSSKLNKVTKATLGMMPDPRARPYLASIGSYMG